MSDNLRKPAVNAGQVMDEVAWKLQLRRAGQSFRRNDWLKSSIALVIGLLFLGLYVASRIDPTLAAYMNHTQAWWPMLGMSMLMFAIACLGYLSAARRYQRIFAAVDQGVPIPAMVRFVEPKHSDTSLHDAWFDPERNPKLSNSLVTRIWQTYPATATLSLGVHSGFSLLDPQTRTPLAMTIDDVTILFVAPATTPTSA